jgi:hypothetical protein
MCNWGKWKAIPFHKSRQQLLEIETRICALAHAHRISKVSVPRPG